jgi:hypothetical protein
MKPLRFIHISKTGGNALATAANVQQMIEWGMYDYEYGNGMLCHRLLTHNKMKDPSVYDWFTVVRNPYNRMLSEYNWFKRTIEINEYLQMEIATVSTENVMNGWHFTEQWRYLEPGFTIHVIHYENLDVEFAELMKQYGHHITLEVRKNGPRDTAVLADLTLETIELINRVYERDFTTFGYEMVHSVFSRGLTSSTDAVGDPVGDDATDK